MMNAIVVSDLHGNSRLVELLLRIAAVWKIASVFIAGDLGPVVSDPAEITDWDPAEMADRQRSFLADEFIPMLDAFLASHRQTHVYAIMGNDDRRVNEPLLLDFDEATRNFHLVHDRIVRMEHARQVRTFFPGEVPDLAVVGYPYVPPGSGAVMDWVKHENRVGLLPMGMDPCTDLQDWGIRTVDTGCPSTIQEDLDDVSRYLSQGAEDLSVPYEPACTIFLFHAPPYNTPLDQIAPPGRYEHHPLPDHIGSTEIRRFIEREHPYLVLCGHCHEAVVLADYRTNLGGTCCVNPGSQAHIDVLSIVQFDPFHLTDMKQFFINAE